MHDADESRRPGRRFLFWIAILYFAEGLPLGIFYDLFPVHFRQEGVELWKIGFMSLLGLAWTVKVLWAPAVDRYRHHRRWMFGADLGMALVLVTVALSGTFGPGTWIAIAAFTILSATNDIAIDGYSIEHLERRLLGLGNGLRIAAYRVAMSFAGLLLVLDRWLEWWQIYLVTSVLLVALGSVCLTAPLERDVVRKARVSIGREWAALVARPGAVALVLAFLLVIVWLADQGAKWSRDEPRFWWIALGASAALLGGSALLASARDRRDEVRLSEGVMFGSLMEVLSRPGIIPVVVFILIFKLSDTAMGFMVKPFWVDSGFTATQIGLVSVNVGIWLSILGGVVGGMITDRVGIFRGLWSLGLLQAASNLGYAYAAYVIVPVPEGEVTFATARVMYTASVIESFTGGLGTGAFLAFLMAIVSRKNSASEYAILSAFFALSRSVAGLVSGFGAESLGYAPYFLLTFFLGFPAYVLLPWVRRALADAGRRDALESP